MQDWIRRCAVAAWEASNMRDEAQQPKRDRAATLELTLSDYGKVNFSPNEIVDDTQPQTER